MLREGEREWGDREGEEGTVSRRRRKKKVPSVSLVNFLTQLVQCAI